MGFLFGLLVGTALSSGGTPSAAPTIGNIPMRCIAALEISEKDYRDCRFPSLNSELARQFGESSSGWSVICGTDDRVSCTEKNIKWEIAALRKLDNAAAEKSPQPKQ